MMSRPHIECIHESALAWERAAVGGEPDAEAKILSRDPEGGNQTVLIRLPRGWRQPAPLAHPAPEEIFVLSGCLRVGAAELKRYHYLRIAEGVRHGPAEAPEETVAIWILEGRYGPVPGREPAEGDLLHVDAGAMQWRPTWVPGPRPGLHIKLLYVDPVTGGYSRLIRAEPGWHEDRLEHHDCSEEAFTLEGEMYLGNTRETWGAGSYFWRPPGIKHGPMRTGPGALFFLRTDGPLVNHYTIVEPSPRP